MVRRARAPDHDCGVEGPCPQAPQPDGVALGVFEQLDAVTLGGVEIAGPEGDRAGGLPQHAAEGQRGRHAFAGRPCDREREDTLAPQAEPSPGALVAIVRTARERKVTAIFLEPLVSPKLAETLAREVRVRLLTLDPIEGVTRKEAAEGIGYVELMTRNLQSLREGLGCR